MSVVEIKDVGKTFEGGTTALEGIELAIGEREFVSLIGPSGCGKSTLLRIVGDLIRPTAGTVRVNGKPAPQARADRDYGIVFQDAVLYDWRTVARNFSLPLELARWKRRRRTGRGLRRPGMTRGSSSSSRACARHSTSAATPTASLLLPPPRPNRDHGPGRRPADPSRDARGSRRPPRSRLGAGSRRARARIPDLAGVDRGLPHQEVPGTAADRDRKHVLDEPTRADQRWLVHLSRGARRLRDRVRTRAGHGARARALARRRARADAVHDRGERDPDHRLRADHERVVRPVLEGFEDGDRRRPLLLSGAREHAPRPDLGPPAVDRIDAVVRSRRARDVPPRPHPDSAAVHLHLAP